MEQNNSDNGSKVGKCGLNNIGNTCYMNSVLQLLLHCRPLLSFLIKKNVLAEDNVTIIERADYEHYLERGSVENAAKDERKRQKLDKNSTISIKKADIDKYKMTSITAELAKIVEILIDKGAARITPASFKQMVDKKFSSFRGYSQHDAHEFIIHILDAIIEETGIESEPVINNVPENLSFLFNKLDELKKEFCETTVMEEKKKIIEKINELKKSNKELLSKYNGLNFIKKLYEDKYNPFIYQIQTIIVHSVECTECKNITLNYENTPVLQLYVNDSLDESFEQLIKTETIENYKCTVCNAERTINKSCKLWRTPSILFIQLKRFEVLPNGRIRKNNNGVDIPLTIDLNPYCDQNMNGKTTINRVYKLKGFSNHMGTLSGGHYTADCECIVDNKTWYHFDDSSVTRSTNGVIDTSNAYILMYELV